ncbi:PfkB family carbohydrate kinase [Nocardia yamanashiensis]|uniref:PfkB family carbohydrate kinase n=1 Tax=Nocardia yamanashiensis TaxID=209247 RepID=UPI001E44218B|nr:PfkB family carbohydrate kinase [Nocardia yamanashiensis]UGT46015.1 PfkB family carbohydrate kinase [Nocardia yamanashiensis]
MNPAYDVTYRVERLARGRAQRVLAVEQRLGGKGINVARVLAQLGKPVRTTGFADLEFGAAVGAELSADFVPALPWVRRTLVVSESGDGTATGLWEPGARVNDPRQSVDRLLDRVRTLLPELRGLVVSGSLPAGVADSVPADLARIALAAGVPVICDVDGPALLLAAAVPGVVLMPNNEELARLLGPSAAAAATGVIDPDGLEACPVDETSSGPAVFGAGGGSTAALAARLRPLVDGGVRAVIATRGAAGMVAATTSGAWAAWLGEPLSGNPTGAGDAAAAAVAAGLAAGGAPDWPEILRDAIATSAAAVVVPIAGAIDTCLRARLLPAVVVSELGASAREARA